MFQNLTGWHALIVLAIVLLVFGAAKLPALARSLGQSVRILKTEVAEPTPTTSPITEAAAHPSANAQPHPSADAQPAAPRDAARLERVP